MTIETKYQSDNIVWFLFDNKVQSTNIKAVRIIEHINPVYKKAEIVIEYNIGIGQAFWKESELFPSKEKLLNSL
jgi:hypothetical protein